MLIRQSKEQLHPPKHLPDARSGPDEAARDEKPKEGHSEEGCEDELRADLRHLNLEPRTHALGAEGAMWGGVDVGGDSYKRGVDVDIDDVRPAFIVASTPCIYVNMIADVAIAG